MKGDTLSTTLYRRSDKMRFFAGLILWLILLILCWPLALLALILYPFIWLILLPFRLLGITVDAVFELLKSILLLPARLLRGPRRATDAH
jgi:cobalamin biosynthesis protein CobD/CbiB